MPQQAIVSLGAALQAVATRREEGSGLRDAIIFVIGSLALLSPLATYAQAPLPALPDVVAATGYYETSVPAAGYQNIAGGYSDLASFRNIGFGTGSSILVQTTLGAPSASVRASATEVPTQGAGYDQHATGYQSLRYLVTLTARTPAGLAALATRLAASPIAYVSGKYIVQAQQTAYALATITTGDLAPFMSGFAPQQTFLCNAGADYFRRIATNLCNNGGGYSNDEVVASGPFILPINFIADSEFLSGGANTLLSTITLKATVYAGSNRTDYAQGCSMAFIDPTIGFANDLSAADFQIVLGMGTMSRARRRGRLVAFPNNRTGQLWGLGFAVADVCIRRRRATVRVDGLRSPA